MPSFAKLLALASAIAYWVNAELIDVNVGEGGLYFVHPDLIASPGDIINFRFVGDNHSVTESAEFSTPCLPKGGGFSSGFVDATQAEADLGGVSFLLTVNDTEPIWYYCAQIGHCQGGMVGSINANRSASSNEQYYDFYSLAKQATAASIPSTTGGGLLFTGSPSSPLGVPTTSGSTSSVNSGGSISITSSTSPTLPPSTTTASLTQTSNQTANTTLSSTSPASTAPIAAAVPAAGGTSWGLRGAGFIAACFLPIFLS